MKRISKIIFCLFSFLQLSGQNCDDYAPLEFHNLEPEWMYLCSDSSIVGYDDYDFLTVFQFTGTNHIHYEDIEWRVPLIEEGYLYSITDTRWDDDRGGALIEKIDLESGTRIWKQAFDFRTNDYRELILDSYIDDDQLHLTTAEIFTPDNHLVTGITLYSWWPVKAGLKFRSYDLEDGTLTSLIRTDTTQTDYVFLNVKAYKNNQLRRIGDNYAIHVIDHYDDSDLPYISIDTVNRNGVRLNPTDTINSILLNPDSLFYLHASVRKIAVTDAGIYIVELLVPYEEGTVASTSTISFYDHDNVLQWSHHYSSLDDSKDGWVQIAWFDENYVFLNTRNINSENNGLLGFNVTGELVFDSGYEGDRLNYLTDFKNENDFTLSVFGTSGIGESRQLKLFRPENGQLVEWDSIGLINQEHIALLTYATVLDEEHHLLEISSSLNCGLTTKQWLKVRTEDFLEKTSAVIAATPQPDALLTILPNPVTDVAQIMIHTDQSLQLSLYDLQGTRLKNYKLEFRNETLDLSDLSPATYFIVATDDSGTTHTYKIIKI